MAKQFTEIEPPLKKFIEDQKIFFVGTAAAEGRVNVSPKGMDTFRIINSNRVLWLNLTGSGNETAAHLLESNRITIMFCAFEGKPNILRLYGTANVICPKDESWLDLITLFPSLPGARQLFDVTIDLVQTSCGFGVPFMEFLGEREALTEWAAKQGEDKLSAYRELKNKLSLDGKPTGL